MKHKRLFTLLLALCLILSIVPMQALADSRVIASGKWDGGPITWKITADGTLTISGNRSIQNAYRYDWHDYVDVVTHIVVEDGIPYIPKYCFSDMTNVRSVQIGNTVSRIEKEAFRNCSSLQAVVIPANVESISPYAFAGCSSLASLTFAEGCQIETIEECCFYGSGITELTTPPSLRAIEKEAFANCSKLTSLTLTSGLESIGTRAFSNCSNLATLIIPETVLGIYDDAFEYCNLEHVEFHGAGICPLAGMTSLNTLVIGGSVTNLKADTFSGCTALANVTITAPVETIGKGAFKGCTSLKEIELPKTLKSIDAWAFEGSGLVSITLPESLQHMGINVFSDCADLVYVNCGDSVDLHLYAYAFKGCTSLTTVDLGKVSYIGNYIFEGCTALSSIVFPSTVTQLYFEVFTDCDTLRTVYFSGDAPNYSYNTFENVTVTVYYPANNDTWTEDIMQDYGGDITWLPMCEEHDYTSVITNPAVTIPGYTTHTCTVCGFFYMDNYVPAGHTYTDDKDTICDDCGWVRHVDAEYPDNPPVVHMFRMYDPNSGEHFYTGSEVEKSDLLVAGWNYEGIGFSFPVVGAPVYRLYDPVYGEHLYTMDIDEVNYLIGEGWNNEGIAFNTAPETEVPQYRLHNPNEKRGAYHFTSSTEERDNLLAVGWEYQGIGWYSCWK